MACLLDLMSSVSTQINHIGRCIHTGNRIPTKLNPVPDVVVNVLVKASINKSIIINPDDACNIDLAVIANTDDSFTRAYIALSSNLKSVVVDKVPVYINHKNSHGYSTSYVVIIPESLFDPEATVIDTAKILYDIYIKILCNDTDMTYEPSYKTLQLSVSTKINIPIYDITMVLSAISFMRTNLAAMYEYGHPDETFNFTNYLGEMFPSVPEKMRSNLNIACSKYGDSSSKIQSNTSNGRLVKSFFGFDY